MTQKMMNWEAQYTLEDEVHGGARQVISLRALQEIKGDTCQT